MILKSYQAEALEYYEKFLKLCRESGDLHAAYGQVTDEWRFRLTYRPLPSMEQVPYVCLRIPTGGGKTMIGGMAIERINRAFLTPRTLTLWLVPSEPIRDQTLKALRAPKNILHQAVQSALGEVSVLDIDEALRMTPHVVSGSNVIIVATMQAFKQEETGRLSVYKQNGSLMEHFTGVTDPAVRGNMSLVDVLRMHHPFVIVDEAHNQGTPLAFDTLTRFEPRAILELTATPDRTFQPSNVLYSVSASVLQAEEMIKMPLELVHRPNWQDALRDAIVQLNQLQQKAEQEQQAGGEYLRPIMLLQAERRDAEHETLTPEKVKTALIEDFGLPENEIAIATGTTDEIAGEDLLAATCPVRFIITVDKLREGWDCPFAYVLCSFRNTSSATAAEQILGRILRMPRATKKVQPELNMAYAFVTSGNLDMTVASLKDGLVRNGFERQEAQELVIVPGNDQGPGELFTQFTTTTVTVPELPQPEAIPAELAKKVEVVPESSSITIKGNISEPQAKALQNACHTPEGKEAMKQAIARHRTQKPRRVKTPAENGEVFNVPLLQLRQGELWEPFEDSHLLQGEWRLLDYSAELPSFQKPDQKPKGGQMYLEKEKVKFTPFDAPKVARLPFDYRASWDQVQLIAWLDENIFDDTILPDEKAAFLNKAVTLLLDARGFSLDELEYDRFRLREALENKVADIKRQALKKVHQQLLFQPDNFIANDQSQVTFQAGQYNWDWVYGDGGYVELPKHFYPQIGNLKATGEEFECAVFLATQLEGVKFWVRNVERKRTAFSLQTSTDRFYPDFLCQLENGKILAVEYKNKRDWQLPENVEKRQLGELWEKRSNGKCLFIMPEGKDFGAITQKVRG
jgi:type III restriction enzyme